MMGCVYQISFQNDKKSYIGITMKSAEERLFQHIKGAKKGFRSLICKAIRKNGIDNIKLKILHYSDSEQILKQFEKKFIKKKNTLHPNGYNMTEGGNGVINPCSISMKRRVKAYKRTINKPEEKKKLIERQKNGAWSTPELRKERSDLVKKMWKDPEYRTRVLEARKNSTYKRSEDIETLKKLSISIKKNRWTKQHRIEASKTMCKLWRTKSFRLKRKNAFDKIKDKLSEINKRKWTDPKYVKKMKRIMKEVQSRPEIKKMKSENTKRQMSDPLMRKRISESVKLFFRKKRISLLKHIYYAIGNYYEYS